MKHTPENIFKDAQTIRMTDAEKTAMRHALIRTVAAHPVKGDTPLRPEQFRPVRSPYNTMWTHFAKSFVYVLVGLVIGTTGVASASLSALPGDIFYPVKTEVIEKGRLALAKTPEAKARVQVAIVTTRLNELDTVTAKNRTDEKTLAALGAQLDKDFAQFDTTLASVSTETAFSPETTKEIASLSDRIETKKKSFVDNSALSARFTTKLADARIRIDARTHFDNTLAKNDSAPTIVAVSLSEKASTETIMLAAKTSTKEAANPTQGQIIQTLVAEEKGTIQGRVVVGPLCPIQKIEVACDKTFDYKGYAITVYKNDGKTIFGTQTLDSKGNFSLPLQADTYILSSPVIGTLREPIRREIQVKPGEEYTVTFEIDSGIR